MRDIWQMTLTIIGSYLGWFIGNGDGLMYALLAFIIADYVTGLLCGIAEKRLSSEIGFKGICRKAFIFILVGAANIVDMQVIRSGSVVRTAVVFFYLSNEGISIIENAGRLGVPIPERLTKIFEQLKGENDEDKRD